VSAVGAKGIGEIGITGAAAAIANAVYHATGKRVRDLPITPNKLKWDIYLTQVGPRCSMAWHGGLSPKSGRI
jgi:hypothetical protein